jgi:hypothetical protein
VAEALKVSNESGQTRTEQTTQFDVARQGGVMDTTAIGTPVRQGMMLGDLQGRLHDLDLLSDAR